MDRVYCLRCMDCGSRGFDWALGEIIGAFLLIVSTAYISWHSFAFVRWLLQGFPLQHSWFSVTSQTGSTYQPLYSFNLYGFCTGRYDS